MGDCLSAPNFFKVGPDLSPTAAEDLRWFFCREATGPLRSNFGGMVQRLALRRGLRDCQDLDAEDEELEARARAGGVGKVLRALDPHTAEVLWRAFGGNWPEEMGSLGEIAALAALTPTAQRAHAASGDTESIFEWVVGLMERSHDGAAFRVLQQIRREALALRRQALAEYLTVRRRVGTPCRNPKLSS